MGEYNSELKKRLYMLNWPHAPPHRLLQAGTYIVTGATYQKEHFFKSEERLRFLQDSLLKYADNYQWKLQAWSIFPNHYHFIAYNSENPASLQTLVKVLHQTTANHINREDNAPSRCVWYQFWDTYLSFAQSYFARLKYVHQNAVHHKIVKDAADYPWCSAAWFCNTAPTSFQRTIDRFKIDNLRILDDF